MLTFEHLKRDSSLPPNTAPLSSSAAPLSLPSQSRRLPPYSSGPLAPAQPPSLPGGPPVSQISITNSNSQPLDLKTSYDRIASSRGLDQARSTFSNTLPSLRRRSHYVTPVSTSDGGDLSEVEKLTKCHVSAVFSHVIGLKVGNSDVSECSVFQCVF